VEYKQRLTPGAIALVGSGEYTPAMEATDRFLLDTRGGPAAARVVVIPTASGQEPGSPEGWNRMGVAHFSALGAQVTPVMLLDRQDAADARIVATLHSADLYYFSGGSPEYLIETLRDTPAWDAIRAGYANGAVIGGCSAGAMMLGGYTLGIRALRSGQPPQWRPALGLVAGVTVIPHFDRVSQFVGEELFRAILASAPDGLTLVGVDEDTALVCTPSANGAAPRWRVTGRQGVAVFNRGTAAAIYRAGDQVSLGEA
jgi:cyanophycinase